MIPPSDTAVAPRLPACLGLLIASSLLSGCRPCHTHASFPGHGTDPHTHSACNTCLNLPAGRPAYACSGWASSISVYNRLLETRPDLVEVSWLAG